MIPFSPSLRSSLFFTKVPERRGFGDWSDGARRFVFAPWDVTLNEEDGGGLDEVMAPGRGTTGLQDLVPLTFRPLCQMPICPAVQWDTRTVDQTPLPIDH